MIHRSESPSLTRALGLWDVTTITAGTTDLLLRFRRALSTVAAIIDATNQRDV
jgi:hypothetical protein